MLDANGAVIIILEVQDQIMHQLILDANGVGNDRLGGSGSNKVDF
jgi:hypothetical protein